LSNAKLNATRSALFATEAKSITSPSRATSPALIGHTPVDVIVVDEEHRQPIQRPLLTVVIDVYSRVVLGFAIYLEKPSAFTTGFAIAHSFPLARIVDWETCQNV
jgi:transposase InsO family protein